MSYPPQYSSPYPGPSYGPPPRRRGLKRIIFGSLGIVANLVGLVVMPIIGAMVAAIIIGMISYDNIVEVSPDGGSIAAGSVSSYMITAPQDEAESVTCTFDGNDVQVEPTEDVAAEPSMGTLHGEDHVEIYQLTVLDSQEITVDCQGASSVGYVELGVMPVFIAIGIGFLLPVVLGIAAIALLISGIIGRVRSARGR